MVHLTGSVAAVAVDGDTALGLADAQLLFTGPGLQFDRERETKSCPFCATLTFDDQFLLNPGTYTFSALTDGNIVGDNPFSGTAFSSASLSVNADFTTVPEPRFRAIILALLATICCAVSRWRYAAATVKT
jgi:hypothetical protein